MKKVIGLVLNLCFTSVSYAATAMNHEGACTGALPDGSTVELRYYSDFDGCSEKSRAAVTFTQGLDGLYTGERSFNNDQDLYSFKVGEKDQEHEAVRLVFADSTGNTSGALTYLDPIDGETKTIEVQCEIRDYEYLEC